MALDASGVALIPPAALAGLVLALAGFALAHRFLAAGPPRRDSRLPARFARVLPGPGPDGPRSGRRRAAFALSGFVAGISCYPLIGPAAAGLALILAGMGCMAPQLVGERRRAGAKSAALRQVPLAIAQLRAQVAMGVGIESALRKVAYSPLAGPELANHLHAVLAAYGLGRPIDLALAEMGRRLDSAEIEILARSVSQARRLGVGLEETLARTEFEFAAAQERRVAAAAERAQLRSQLLIVGCYLPAFMAMVLAPLFLGMLQGLGT